MNTPQERISYTVICKQQPKPSIYFNSYEEAVEWAKIEQPTYRPHYIIERVESFKICGMVGGLESEDAE